ncbi:lysozyme [Sphingomonas koreensis]
MALGFDPGPDDGRMGPKTLGAAMEALGRVHVPSAPLESPVADLTPRIVLELTSHEAIVLEWYRDSEGVGTWAIGVTNASGHSVDRYKDNPQPLRKCLEVSIWLMRAKYLPDVLQAFAGVSLTEAQLAAALSFHYNTGAILRTDWVRLYKEGKRTAAREFLVSHYLNGGDLTERRAKEAALFFDGRWSQDGKVAIYDVAKPSYSPKWSSAKRVDISAEVAAILAGEPA